MWLSDGCPHGTKVLVSDRPTREPFGLAIRFSPPLTANNAISSIDYAGCFTRSIIRKENNVRVAVAKFRFGGSILMLMDDPKSAFASIQATVNVGRKRGWDEIVGDELASASVYFEEQNLDHKPAIFVKTVDIAPQSMVWSDCGDDFDIEFGSTVLMETNNTNNVISIRNQAIIFAYARCI
jgi:hypothetical protein